MTKKMGRVQVFLNEKSLGSVNIPVMEHMDDAKFFIAVSQLVGVIGLVSSTPWREQDD